MTQFNGNQYQTYDGNRPGPGNPATPGDGNDAERREPPSGNPPVPFIPYFGWKPGMEDFPVTLLPPASAIRVPETATFSGEHAWLKNVEVLAAPRPKSRKVPTAITATILAGAVAAGVYWTQFRDAIPTQQSASSGQTTATASLSPETNATTASGATLPSQGGGLPARQDPIDADPSADPAETSTSAPAQGQDQVEPSPVILDGPSVTAIAAEEGATLASIAEANGIDVATLVWSNPEFGPTEELEAGATVYLPDGGSLVHTVVSGETHASIAAAYDAALADLYDLNGRRLDPTGDLIAGDAIIVAASERLDRGMIDYYTVEVGDSLWEIASYYGLQPETLAWANELPRPELIHPGQELIIPPGNGALVIAEAGDSVATLIEPFEADYDAVVDYAFNDLAGPSVLQVGQWVLIPGDLFTSLGDGPTELSASTVAGEDVVGPATGDFIWPTDGTITQEFGGQHNGLDIANEEWTPINAADGGIVIFAGWNDYGLGYAVGIDHGNGYVTWYGHMAQQPYVEVGQVIWQGGYLGPMGTTGRSTGPHLHFVIMEDGVYQDPWPLIE